MKNIATLKTKIKKVINKSFGIWMVQTAQLPPGLDLYEDIKNKLGFKKVVTIFDVGANIGETVASYHKEFPDAKIMAFEPFQYAFSILSNRYQHEKLVRAEKLALADYNGEAEVLAQSPDNSVLNSLNNSLSRPDSTSSNKEKITVQTLDTYVNLNHISQVDFLKIDTEGYELKVLEGAKETIAAGKIKMVFAEVGFHSENKRNTPFADLHQYMMQNDYLLYGVYNIVHFANLPEGSFGNVLYVHKNLLPEIRWSPFTWNS